MLDDKLLVLPHCATFANSIRSSQSHVPPLCSFCSLFLLFVGNLLQVQSGRAGADARRPDRATPANEARSPVSLVRLVHRARVSRTA